ncbi:MAG: ATP synthase F1 subunit delta [Thermoanaerobaculaceae bacterium]|jgi:F-type H+-transporting ATPase subunit delta|nr:ATP synthase F1 subunit delta [Thermoanaerobaculaceae bacterium]
MSRRIARPYAAALYHVLEKEGVTVLRQAETQLAAVAEVLRQDPAFLRAFEVPSVTPTSKRELITTVAKAVGLRPETTRLLEVMTEHVRLRFLPEVVDMLRTLADRREGLQRGRVEVPAALDPSQVAALNTAMAHLLGGRVELAAEVRPSLLAGFVVRVGSRVWDASIEAQLRRFAASRDIS